MNNEQRIALIRQKLENALKPLHLQIIDVSESHKNHPGAKSGRGHFEVDVVSTCFENTPLVDRHRMVFAALGNLMQTDIHALIIHAKSPQEMDNDATS